jgi:hypothetical protein
MVQIHFTLDCEGLRQNKVEWMKNLHNVLHGQYVNNVSWSTRYYAKNIKSGWSNAKHGVVAINSIASRSCKYTFAMVGTQTRT